MAGGERKDKIEKNGSREKVMMREKELYIKVKINFLRRVKISFKYFINT